MKKNLLFLFLSGAMYAQVDFPHAAPSAGPSTSERVSNFTVGGAGNDRLEIANGTQVDGQFIPTFWSYRDTNNTFSMVFTSSIAPNRDTGTSPLMLFTTTITPQVDFGVPGSGGDFVWGPSGTYLPIANRPLFEWRNSSAKLMTIIANGNVGIGTSTPTALFNTKGTVRFQDLANQVNPSFMLGTDANGNVFEYPVPSGGTGSSDADWLTLTDGVPMSINDNIYTNGFVGFNTQSPTANIHSRGTVRFQDLANQISPSFMLGTDANGNVFEYPVPSGGAGTSDADWLTLTDGVPMSINDNIYTNGFVGFNTQSPTANIHSRGTVRFQDLANQANPSFMLGTDSNGNVFEYPVPSGGSGSPDADWLTLTDGVPMSVNDNIYTNGFVGFNTQSPTANIHSRGTVRFQDLANQANPSFMLGTDSNGNVFEYPVPSGGSGSPDADWLTLTDGVPMSINDNIYTNGFVGFNTQSPTANIHSRGTVRFQDLNNGVTPVFMLGTDVDGNVLEYPVPSGGSGSTPDADWLMPDNGVSYDINNTIYTNGDVGINVQNPTASFHVDGTVRFSSLANSVKPAFMLGTDADGNVAEYPVPADGTGGVSDADWLKPDGTLPMSIGDNIYTNGKVGINVSEFPSMVGSEDVSFYNLYVTGGILTEEVRVALTGEWADYVFKADYKLPTLQEVERHIKEEGHLKNIPAADQVKANGIELGEMDKLLLEKVEELTLYVIDLNKKIEEQQKEIEALKNRKQ